MNGLGDIIGQERAITRLRGALSAGKPHHAYLFDGPEGVGKRATAFALAQALSCEPRPGEGCGECGPCRKIAGGIHPDVIPFEVFDEEGKEKGQAERVRELIPRLAYAPNEGRARVVIIDPAEGLNSTSANILLKTLEEPPPRTQFVLITPVASSLLTTIRSRCQRVQFLPLADEAVERRLVERHSVERGVAQAAAALAGGSLGRALQLAASDALPKRRERAARMVAAAHGKKAHAALDAAAEVAGDRDEAEATLEFLWVMYRDAVLLSEGLGDERVAAGRRAEAAKLASLPSTSLLLGLHAVEEARSAIDRYVSPQLAIERLLLRLGAAGAA